MIEAADVKAGLRAERVLIALGLLADRRTFRRQHAGFLIRCPVHDDRTPSCSVQDRDGVVLWNCHACGESGDALDLIAAVRGGTFADALAEGAQLAGVYDDGHERRAPAPRQAPIRTERPYPPQAEVEALWRATTDRDRECEAWLASRGVLYPDAAMTHIGGHAVTRALPARGELPAWASYQGASWRETGHRLLVPMFDAAGALRSVRAIRVVEGDAPKRLPPAGYRASGLVMANDLALGMLRGTFEPRRALVLEGEPDFIDACAAPMAEPVAKLGVVSGSWTEAFALRVPATALVLIYTDRDEAGDRYASAIRASLPANECRRWARREVSA